MCTYVHTYIFVFCVLRFFWWSKLQLFIVGPYGKDQLRGKKRRSRSRRASRRIK